MNFRPRVLAALLALVALSAYFAEGALTTCPPGMEDHSTYAGASAGHAHGDVQGADSGTPDSGTSDAPRCPLGLLGAGGSCVAASLPAPTVAFAPAFGTHETTLLTRDATHDRLAVAAHFRPPRA